MNFLLLAPLLIPLLTAVTLPLFRHQPNIREAFTLFGGVLLFIATLLLYQSIDWQSPPEQLIAEPIQGLSISLQPDPLGIMFSLLVGFLWPITSLYAIGYMRGHNEENQTRFYIFFALSIAITQGIALSGSLLTLFLFYELLTLATYPLVTHAGTPEAKRAGRLYLGILMGTSILFMLPAIIWSASLAGHLNFILGGILPEDTSSTTLNILLLLFVFGCAKTALMPFHRWLPGAMVAPVPVSALLHAVAVVKAGVFTLLKIVLYIIGADQVSQLFSAELLAYLAGFTLVAASIIALRKDNIKARLAYSTIGQLSYIVLAAMLANSASLIGGSMHIASHAFGKITLFFCAGAILLATHKTKVSELNGIGRRIPITMGMFALAALSTIGLPPFAGMWSKWWLIQGTVDSGMIVLTAALLISSLLNLVYLLELPVRAFFYSRVYSSESPTPPQITHMTEAPTLNLVALSITTFICLLLFLFPESWFELLGRLSP